MIPPDSSPVRDPAGARPGQFTAMISSTALDLPKHRAQAHQACLDAGFFPIGMEELPAQDTTGIAASMKMVEQADIYLGVYAFRYGWVPDGQDMSITEMEFDRAVARKKEGELREILVFTAHKDHPFTFEDIESDKIAQEKLAKFKTRAAEGRVRKEFRSPEEFHRLVLHALEAFKNRIPNDGGDAKDTHPARTSIPNNLPRLQPFFGREKELAGIAKALDPKSRGWGTLIDGDGGMGKTALAVRAAFDSPAEHFERIVFVSAKQHEQDDTGLRPRGSLAFPSWLAMLNKIAAELKLPDIAKAPEFERVSRLQEALSDRRILLVLDNLETFQPEEQTELFNFLEFMPGGCKALLTSRTFAGNRTLALDLQKLDRNAALRMLAEIALHNGSFAESSEGDRVRLYDQAQGNALLLRWVAGQVGHGHCTSLGDALDYLRAGPQGNDALKFVFGDVVKSLDTPEVRLLAALTWPAQPIAVEAIAEIADVPLENSRRLLKTLTNRSLVVPDQEERQYALVPMVADFLRRERPEVVAETGDRLEKRAYALILENGYGKHDRFPMLDAAWPTVAAAVPRFLAGTNDRLQSVWRALETFLRFSGRWDEGLILSEGAVNGFAAIRDVDNAGRRALKMCWFHNQHRNASEIFACVNKAETYWRDRIIAVPDRADVHFWRGHAYQLTGNYSAAIAEFQESVTLWRTFAPERKSFGRSLNALARVEHLAGDLDAAERDYREALRIADDVSAVHAIPQCIGDLAELMLDRKDWEEAETLARKALPMSEKIGSRELIASNCRRLARALLEQGKGADGLSYARRAVDIYTRLSSPNLKSSIKTLRECEE